MSMIKSNYMRSPCELIREINDLVQGDSEEHKRIRKLLAHTEKMTKEMSIEISKYRPDYHLVIWKQKNQDLAEDDKRRTSKNYKYHKL